MIPPHHMGTSLPTPEEAPGAGWGWQPLPSICSLPSGVGGRAAAETLVSEVQTGGSGQVAGGLDVPPQQSLRQDEEEASWGETERPPRKGQEALPAWTQGPGVCKLPKPPASRALCQAKRAPRAAFPSSGGLGSGPGMVAVSGEGVVAGLAAQV